MLNDARNSIGLTSVAAAMDYYPFGQIARSYNPTAYKWGFNGMEKDDEVKGSGNSYDFGARIYDPRLGRWLAIDPLAVKFPYSSPYSFVLNMPTIAVDPDGKDVFLVIWFAKSSDGSVGHTALAVENYKTVTTTTIVAGKSVAMTEKVPDGTYTYYDLWPEKPVGKTEMQSGVTPDYNTKTLNNISDFTTKDPSVSGEVGKVSEFGEGMAPDAVIRIKLDETKTSLVKQEAEKLMTKNASYNACNNNCTTFAVDAVNAAEPSLKGEEFLDAPWIMEQMGYKDTNAKTPNQTYRDAKKLPNASEEKTPKKQPENKEYLDIVK